MKDYVRWLRFWAKMNGAMAIAVGAAGIVLSRGDIELKFSCWVAALLLLIFASNLHFTAEIEELKKVRRE